jgi:antitoxin YefM
MTIIQVMSDTMPLAAVKAHFSEVADRVQKQQERIVVTRNGRPAVVLISPDDLESLEETLAILSDRRLLAKVRKGLAEADAGKGIPLDQVVASRRRG